MLGVLLKIGDVTPGAGDPGALAFAVEMPVEQLLGRVALDLAFARDQGLHILWIWWKALLSLNISQVTEEMI